MRDNNQEPLVYVVDDDPSYRTLIVRLMNSVHLEAVGFAKGSEFLAAYDASRPGCAVLDVRLPDQSGLEVLERLGDRDVQLPVIIITGHADVPMAVRALKLGAVDFLEKPVRNQDLLEMVQHSLARDLSERHDRHAKEEIAARLESLTPREREVLDLVVSGRANKVIADDLGLSMKTVEFHRSHVMRKMRAESLADLVRQVLAVQNP